MRNKEIHPEEIPFKPNPNKYRYLLHNPFEDISNLIRASAVGSPDQIPNEPTSASSPKKRLLGDFTVYKVNREFENF
jgi:hypothetical protein